MGIFSQIARIRAVSGPKDNDIIYKGSFYMNNTLQRLVNYLLDNYPEGKLIGQGKDVYCKNLEKEERADMFRLKQEWGGNIREMIVKDEPQTGRCIVTFDLNYPEKTHASKMFDLMKSNMMNAVKPEKRVIINVAPQQSSSSNADELLKWKKLKDEGAITEEEYEAKKKQLLGL